MRTVTLPLPMMGFIISTRAALAAGLALTLGDRIPARRRRTLGTALIAFGAATTLPIAAWLFRRNRMARTGGAVASDAQLIGATRLPRKGDDPF